MLRVMRNVVVLAIAQFFGAFGQVATVLLAGLVGTMLAPTEALATVPVGTAVIGVAVATLPVGLAMQRWGRRPVLLGGAVLCAAGCLFAAYALEVGSFPLYCVATLIVGTALAFIAQYRFAAADSVGPAQAGQAITWVMLGTLGAAIVSPWLMVATRSITAAPFAGSYLTLCLTFLLSGAALLAYREIAPLPAANVAGRPLSQIRRESAEFVVAVAAAALAYGVMALLMTATPISMHMHHGHSIEDTAFVLQSHVIGMYAPAFFTGILVGRLGTLRVMVIGLVANAACAGLALAGEEFWNYWVALTLLGLGWNLLFVAATTQLTRTYRPEERYRVQTANDFLMFGVMAVASLGAGPLLAVIGWRGLNLLALGLLAVLALLALKPKA